MSRKPMDQAKKNEIAERVENILGRHNFFPQNYVKNECKKCGPTDNFGYWFDGQGICEPCFQAELRRGIKKEQEEIKFYD